MIPRISIFLISFYFSEACVRTIPPEEVYITSTPENLPATNAPSAPCYMCEISSVAPTLADPTNTEFVSTQSEDANQCPIENVSCKRKDGAVCASVKIQAMAAAATEVIGMRANVDKSDATLSCAKGTLLEQSCATCPEVDLSKAELIPEGSMISKEEAITADGCKETTIRCSYTPTPGTVALSSSLNGILADGMAPHIGELPSPGIGKDYSILTCQNNGGYITSRGVTGIINFRCQVNSVNG